MLDYGGYVASCLSIRVASQAASAWVFQLVTADLSPGLYGLFWGIIPSVQAKQLQGDHLVI